MSKKKYEIFYFIRVFIVFVFIIESVFVYLLFNIKISKYIVLNGISIKNNLVQFVVSSNELKLFIANSTFYIKDKKYSYQIKEVNKGILKRKGKEYHELIIKYKGVNNIKDKDFIKISIFQEKIKLIEIFNVIWKEGMDEETK